MGLLSDAGNALAAYALRARQALDRVLPRRVAPENFPPSNLLPGRAGPAGEGYNLNANNQTRPNVQVIQDWIVPSTLGWTLDAMQGAILQLENGNLYAAHSLMLAMTRDPTIAHGLMVRRMSLSALKERHDSPLWFPPSIPEEARDALRKVLRDAVTPQDLATAHGYTVMLGLAPVTNCWYEKTEETGATYWQWRSEVLESGHCQYRPDERRYYFIARSGYLQLVDDGNAWALFKSLGDRRHHLDCAVRTLAVLWFIVQEAIRYHRAYNAEYGRPIKGLMVPDSQRLSEDVAQLVSQASGLYGGSVIILPQFGEGSGQASFDLKLIEAKSRGFQTFTALADTARNLITLYLLGVLETTGGESASNAKAKTQLRVSDRITAGDARVEEDAMNRILRRWADFNAFEEAPEWRIDTDPPEDDALAAQVAKDRAEALKKTVEALQGMADLGVRITEDRAAQTLKQIGVEWTNRGAAEQLAVTLGAASAAAVERSSDTVLVCWELPPKIARLLSVPGGEAPEELHLTLAVCPRGSIADVLAGLVAVAGDLEPASGFITGVASWPAATPGTMMPVEAELPERAVPEETDEPTTDEVIEEPIEPTAADQVGPGQEAGAERSTQALAEIVRVRSDSQLAYVSLVDAPALATIRDRVLSALEAAGCEVAQNHGYIPHITRAYLPAGSGVEPPGEPIAIRIDRLSVWALGGRVRVPLRIGRTEDEGEELSLCDDSQLENEIYQLTEDVNQLELRTYVRGYHGRFGHGTGPAPAAKEPRVAGKAAARHSERARTEKSVEAHRYAARAHVAVARREVKKGNVEKAKTHLETAKGHRDEANKIKTGNKAQTAQNASAKAKPSDKPSVTSKASPQTTSKSPPKSEFDHKAADAWRSKLSRDEDNAVDFYKGRGYADLNANLRAEKGNPVNWRKGTHDPNVLEKHMKHLDSALAKSEAPHDLVATRLIAGVDPGTFKVGSVVKDHAYMSTSVGHSTFEPENSGNIIKMNINIPKGSKGGFVRDDWRSVVKENEFLMPRGTSLRVTKVEKVGDTHHVYAEVAHG